MKHLEYNRCFQTNCYHSLEYWCSPHRVQEISMWVNPLFYSLDIELSRHAALLFSFYSLRILFFKSSLLLLLFLLCFKVGLVIVLLNIRVADSSFKS